MVGLQLHQGSAAATSLVLSRIKIADRKADRKLEGSDSSDTEGCVTEESVFHQKNQSSQEVKFSSTTMFKTYLQEIRNMKGVNNEHYLSARHPMDKTRLRQILLIRKFLEWEKKRFLKLVGKSVNGVSKFTFL